ncbi:BQ5605_C005g03234 [Microbotryum silenes-dioicae]|uniref:BQ5605_C005g03234 protein n=1 Tax=Microbotryum silenes-dioicae TaxID=796604 RepID=A0A2X0MX74_9BASI|nr:BQ5605_C005g03234 [Microbotryum silenes-dioicae]
MGLLELTRAPAAGPAARLSSLSRSDQQNQLPAHNDNNSTDLGIATQQVHRPRTPLKPLKPHVPIRDDLGPQTAVCTHCKARHWECERSKSTRHFSACCSQGKVRLPPPPQPNPEYRQLLEGSDSDGCIPRECPVSRTPHVSDTSTALPSTRRTLGALNPAVNQRPTFAKTWLICPAETTDTQLGPDGADSRIQRSTLTKLESTLRTGNRLVRELASAKARAAPKWRCLSAIPTPTREIVDRKTLFSRCTVIDVPMVGPSTKLLARSIQEDSFHLNIPLCSSKQAGSSFADKEDEDEEEGDEGNGDGEFSRSQLFAYYLHKRDEYFSIPHCTQRAFLAFVMTDTPRSRPIDSTYLQLDQEKPPPHHGPRHHQLDPGSS